MVVPEAHLNADRPTCSARLVLRPDYAAYDFGPQHPLRPERLRAGLDLFAAANLGPRPHEVLEAPPATTGELCLVHIPRYVEVVERLSGFADDRRALLDAAAWGLGPGDSPAFPGMHEPSAGIAGGSLHALEAIWDGRVQHAFNPMGGLHHAMPGRASGFCIYNDPAVAIAGLLRLEPQARVLYLDFDAHHGDGVQAIFYADPRVLTFSIHETGHHLFPGTGFVDELGDGPGRGTKLNLPVEPYTEDGSWLEALHALLPALGERFAPLVVVSQHGCDSHAWDPLTHLRLSTRAYAEQARLVHALAHQHAAGRWLAMGGGGYDWVRVVPRSWAIVWAEMSERTLPDRLPADWLARWSEAARLHDFWPLPARFLDDSDGWPATARRPEIERRNLAEVERLLALAIEPTLGFAR